MRTLRSILLRHPLLAVVMGLAGVMLRLAVPAGFMPMLDQGQAALTPCSGYATAPGTEHHGRNAPKFDNSCAFADLALPLVGGADAVDLTAELFPVIAPAPFFEAASPPRAGLRLRPPLRAPPLQA